VEVATANADALRELHAHHGEPYRAVISYEAETLCAVAPLLQTFAIDLCGAIEEVQDMRRALRNEALFGPLRVRRLNADLHGVNEAGIVEFAADVVAHASLCELELLFAFLNWPAALDAVVDAALARRLQSVSFRNCFLSPASAPALARLLGGDALTSLTLGGENLVYEPAAAVLAAALRANSALTSLTLKYAGVFDDIAATAELLGALTGHASLRALSLSDNVMVDADRAAAGALLGALVAANAPSLTHLKVSRCHLGDDGMRALFEALPHNTHLRKLDCMYNVISDAFAADVLLPAVRANTSLRQMKHHHDGLDDVAAAIARELRSRAPL
jgi:hypothetical protein